MGEYARFSRSCKAISRKLEGKSEVVREDRALETKANTQDLQPWDGTMHSYLGPNTSVINHKTLPQACPQANLVVTFSQVRLLFQNVSDSCPVAIKLTSRWIWVFCLHECLYTMFEVGCHRDQKMVSDPLELRLWVIVSSHVSYGNQNQSLYKNKCS